MSASITIRNAEVVLPGGVQHTDVVVLEGCIAAIGSGLPDTGETINAAGLTLLPGVIDPQVHFREPGATHKEDLHSGSMAAAAGGVTAFLDMPNNKPAVITRSRMAEKKARAAEQCVVHYGFFMGATPDNLEELNAVENVCGIKVFMGASTGDLLVDDPVALERIFANGTRLIAVHAEDETVMRDNQALLGEVQDIRAHPRIRDESAALRATKLATRLSLKHQRRLHVLHLTTEEECDLLRTLPAGHRISAEVCPQHFTLTAPECYERLGTRAQMNPPLRTQRHADALWAALKDGTLQCIATDHAPHSIVEKLCTFDDADFGISVLETGLGSVLSLVHSGKITLPALVEKLTAAPARFLLASSASVDSRLGSLQDGAPADVTVFDPNAKWTVDPTEFASKGKNTPLVGATLKGRVKLTIAQGEIAYDEVRE
ncbi:MAG TPA: dihydroorotase [Deltaproteobacteria bacterium]|nr:dihydroorotase [Deltaproteobacteria bacterium]